MSGGVYGNSALVKLFTEKQTITADWTFDNNILMSGTTTDDQRLRLPYLTTIPTSADNGSIWIEPDNLHIFRSAEERILSDIHVQGYMFQDIRISA